MLQITIKTTICIRKLSIKTNVNCEIYYCAYWLENKINYQQLYCKSSTSVYIQFVSNSALSSVETNCCESKCSIKKESRRYFYSNWNPFILIDFCLLTTLLCWSVFLLVSSQLVLTVTKPNISKLCTFYIIWFLPL